MLSGKKYVCTMYLIQKMIAQFVKVANGFFGLIESLNCSE